MMKKQKRREKLKLLRLFMVISSLSPLFILWAIRGNRLFPDKWFVGACLFMVILPAFFLWLRWHTAKKNDDKRNLVAGTSEDNRSHVLVYLFAILLPFYREELITYRDFAGMLTALAFIIFLFWHLNLHYMNFLFAFFNYRIFTVFPPEDQNPYTGKETFVLITHRRILSPGDRFSAYRLSDTVYLEPKT